MVRDDAVNLTGNALTNQGMDVRLSRLKRTREKRCSKKVFHGDWVLELSSRPVARAVFIAYQPPADLHESGIAGQQIKTDHVALKAQSLDLWYQPASENRQSPFRLALQEKTLSTKDSTK